MSENKELSRLIILGAGASVECGIYPTGEDLINFSKKIIELMDAKHFDKTNEVDNRIKPYLLNLISSGHLSIDSHISLIGDNNEREFLKSYYLSIFLFCTACSEISGNFESGWYTEFSKLILTPLSVGKSNKERLEAIKKNLKKLQVITFNYDVSLEISLRKSLERYFNKKDNDHGTMVKDALKAVSEKIYHPYGSIATVDEILEINFEKLTSDQVGRNITKSIEDEIAKKQKNFVEYLEEIKLRFLAQGAFGKSAKVYKKFKDIIELDRSNLTQNEDIFVRYSRFVFQTIVYVADEIKDVNDPKFFSSARIKVISEERENLKKEIPNKVFDQKPDLLYVLGYGFDETNNEILGLKNIKYQKGCFVTNYEGNQKLERLILDELLSQCLGRTLDIYPKNYFIPLISHKSVSEALKQDFSLFENPTSPLKIQTNLTPYLELKK
ncbi:MAG: hypothetical protein SFV53_03180 [Rickettsiales bacterium]|nr:hypothetical protein [Rickettsiales bacterium]